ncbi:MAG TPA: adenylate/guanylate cyclase domain-containing protein [Polyangia bacterium]|nr:adenylate/guanylate cyclase domain-containing protein [Polyangia bacterium]
MTLPRFFAANVAVLGLIAGGVLLVAVRDSTAAIERVADDARAARAARVVASVEAELAEAERAIDDFEQALGAGIVDDRDPTAVQRYLATELVAQRALTDLTLTTAVLVGYADDGAALLAPSGRRQVTVRRRTDGSVEWKATDRAGLADPTEHDTFRAAAHRDARGQALWSDLAFSQLDADRPVAARRKTLTVQKAVFARAAGAERFVGVLRAGLISETLDRLGAPTADGDPHRVFICDLAGRLVTRMSSEDSYGLFDAAGRPDPDGDVRVTARSLPPEVAAGLEAARAGRQGAARLQVGGRPYLLTLSPIAEGRTQGWLAGVVVPESYYVGALAARRDRLLALLGLALVAAAGAGALGARTVGRGVAALVQSTEAMRRFSFSRREPGRAAFAEIGAALESVERAKTALRAMIKYVPVGLVRQLYDSGRDPALGAETRVISLMFTDIADFTAHAEALPPDRLARALGQYLGAATAAVEATGGTVDKYIGDALMVLWNAPAAQSGHAAAACRGALACAEATAALVGSEAWRRAGLAPWRTRFGIHTGPVLVGNFGAPERLNYTAMGDGVNLAARLEGLNKVYGTSILVSDETRRQAGDAFLFREVDRVAVKGKTHAVAVHELLGMAGDPVVAGRRAALARYEEALAAARARRFGDALGLLAAQPEDGPSRALAVRCEAWRRSPPPAEWDGSWIAPSK